jgi:branched-chain amino acid transport system substrate-binding protein/neutral amino acid transport system substrate-binding protein
MWQQGLSLCLGCGVLVTGCEAGGSRPGLKIGALLPITGDLATYGASMQNAAQLLVKTVNECNGVLGQSVTLISEDDQTDAAIGATAMTKLAEADGVAAVIGAASSSSSSATVPIAVRNQVVQISPASTSPMFTERARKGEFKGFWFRTAPPDTFQGKALALLAIDRQFRRVAVLAVNNDYGNGLLDAFMPTYRGLGGTVTNGKRPTRFDPRATAFDAEVQAAFANQPDAVLLIAYPETGGVILKAAYEAGFLGKATQVMATDGLKDVSFARQVGKTANGRYVVAGLQGTAPRPEGIGFQAFRQSFTATYGKPPTIYDPNTWDAAALLVLAAEAAKATTGVAIRDYLREVANPPGRVVTDVCKGLSLLRQGKSINYQGASGTVDFNGDGDVTGLYEIWQIQADGDIKMIKTLAVQPGDS